MTSLKPEIEAIRSRRYLGVVYFQEPPRSFTIAQQNLVAEYLSDHPNIKELVDLTQEDERKIRQEIGRSPKIRGLVERLLAEFARFEVGSRVGVLAYEFDETYTDVSDSAPVWLSLVSSASRNTPPTLPRQRTPCSRHILLLRPTDGHTVSLARSSGRPRFVGGTWSK